MHNVTFMILISRGDRLRCAGQHGKETMKIICYLNFDGSCREAVAFYGRVFSCEPTIMTYGEMPGNPAFPMEESTKNRVMHAQFQVEGNTVMCSDCMPGAEYICGNHISLSLTGDDTEKLKEYFQKLSEGGKVEMDLEATFWSSLYGIVRDRYGICWQVNGTKQK